MPPYDRSAPSDEGPAARPSLLRDSRAQAAAAATTTHLHIGAVDHNDGCTAACGYAFTGPTVVVRADEQRQTYCPTCLDLLVYGGGDRCHATQQAAA